MYVGKSKGFEVSYSSKVVKSLFSSIDHAINVTALVQESKGFREGDSTDHVPGNLIMNVSHLKIMDS